MSLDRVLSKLTNVKDRGGSKAASCPVCDDGRPALSVWERADGSVDLKCNGHAECSSKAILAKLGLTEADLAPPVKGRDSPLGPESSLTPSSMQHRSTQEDSGLIRSTQDHSKEMQEEKSQKTTRREAKQQPKEVVILNLGAIAAPLQAAIDDALEANLPRPQSGKRQWKRSLFEFARCLKFDPRLEGQPVSAYWEVAREYHSRAPPPKTGAMTASETWSLFIVAFEGARIPIGVSALKDALIEGRTLPIPKCVGRHDDSRMHDVARLCKVLQSKTGGEPFFLGCEALGELFNVDKATAWRWLNVGRVEKWLKVATTGSRKSGKASEYFYLGE